MGGSAHAQRPGSLGKDQHGYFASGHILVKPRAGVAERVLQNIFSGEGAIQSRALDQINVRVVRVPDGKEQMIIDRLSKNPRIEYAELDRFMESNLVPDDPYFSNAWHLPKINAPTAWDNAEGEGVVIAILDSGVNAQHPDLASQVVSGWNVYDNIADTADYNGHGSVVAGSAAAASNNAVGVASVAGKAKIMPIVITPAGYSSTFSMFVAEGLIYAADHGARVANVSYQNQTNYQVTRDAAQYMKDKNGLVVVSAGNTGIFEDFTVTPTMIPISSTDESDVKSSWSSYGDYVAMAAPGSFIWSTNKDGGYSEVHGTSIAGPVAAGVVALIMSANPALRNVDVEDILYSTAVDLGDPGRDPLYGFGRVDAAAAVQMALTYTPSEPEQDTISPTASIGNPLSGATIVGTSVVDVSANDNVGVTKVDLYVNGAFYATDTAAPYSFAWDTSSFGNADVTLAAHAYDAAGNKAVSPGVPVLVRNDVDTAVPVVTIFEPANGATLSGRSVTISASASDYKSVSGMKLFIDGSLVASSSGGALSYSWSLRKVADGTHSILVEATDSSANKASQLIEVIKGSGSTSTGGGGGGKGGPKK
ncbi:MAG: S8 family serine peptidase [Alphaproteobacteria bacterium]